MQAMVLETARAPLRMRERPTPVPAALDILLEVAACGVCRTDLHVVDGELPHPKASAHARPRDRGTGGRAGG
jgi:alcohol dehydrogenase, propanol-preferring